MSIQTAGTINLYDLSSIEPNKISSTNTDEEIESIKKETLSYLEKALQAYKQKSEYRRQPLAISYVLAPINKLIKNNIEKFNSLKYELLDEGVDLSCYEPLDVLLEGFSNRKLFSNMTNDQVQFLRDMVAKENKKLFNSSILYLAIGVSCFAVVTLLPSRLSMFLSCGLGCVTGGCIAQALVFYTSRKELEEVL